MKMGTTKLFCINLHSGRVERLISYLMESGKACMQKLFGTIKLKLLYKTQFVTMPTNDTTRCRRITVHHKVKAATKVPILHAVKECFIRCCICASFLLQYPCTATKFCEIIVLPTYIGNSVGPGDEKHALPPSVFHDLICIVVMSDKYFPHLSRCPRFQL